MPTLNDATSRPGPLGDGLGTAEGDRTLYRIIVESEKISHIGSGPEPQKRQEKATCFNGCRFEDTAP